MRLKNEDAPHIELEFGLVSAVREQINPRKMTQEQLGETARPQPVASGEDGGCRPIDLIVRSFIKMGASRTEVATYNAYPEACRLTP